MAMVVSILFLSIFVYLGSCQVIPMTEADKASWLQVHNDFRINEGAKAMMKLKWNDDLQRLAEQIARSCSGEHSSLRGVLDLGFNGAAENLYMALSTIENAVKAWMSEKPKYDLASNTCLGKSLSDPNKNAAFQNWVPCGHYLTVVSAEITDVGCAKVKCGSKGYMYCDYAKKISSQERKPYDQAVGKNDVGSQCAIRFPNTKADSNGLCSLGDSAGSKDTPAPGNEAENEVAPQPDEAEFPAFQPDEEAGSNDWLTGFFE
jgi:hypothetical protein